MADTNLTSPAAPKGRKWLRRLGWAVALLFGLLIVVYFVVTSGAFFKGVILPKASVALGATITVSDASISPFKEVVLHNLRVETTGTDPLLTAGEVRLRYSLLDIMKGNLHIDEVALVSPVIAVVQNPDGSSNLDPLLKAQKTASKPSAPPAPAAKPPQIDLRKFALTDGTIRQTKLYQGGNRDLAEISHLNVSLENLKNGQNGKLTLGADIQVQNNPPAPGAKGVLGAKLNGSYTIGLSPSLKPALVQGGSQLEVTQAQGLFSQAGGLNASFDCDLTATEIKQVALRLQRTGTLLAGLAVSGPFDMEKTEGRLSIQLFDLNKNALNIAGAGAGLNFGPTSISSTNEVQLAKSGTLITAAGRFNLDQLQVTRTNLTTPTLDLHVNYEVSVDQSAKNITLRALTVAGAQNGSSFITGGLTSPMSIALNSAAPSAGDSTFNLAVTHFNLADWKPFLGDSISSGDVSAKLTVVSQSAGTQKISGNLALADLACQAGKSAIQNLGLAADLEVQMTPSEVQIRRIGGRLTQGKNSGGDFDVSGSFNLTNRVGVITASLANLNQNLLAPLVQSSLADKKLTSISINATVAAKYDPQGASSLKGDLQITNLVIADPKGQLPSTPLETRVQMDVSLNQQVAEIRQCQLALTPTSRATNQIQLTGRVDLTRPTAIQGNLKLAADSLDFTRYYDLFTAQNKSTPAPPSPSPAPTAPPPTTTASTGEDLATNQLPLANFTTEVALRRVYLHDIEVNDFHMLTKIDGSHIAVNPFKLALNGAPVNSTVDLDLGVPGYRYALNFGAQAVPLAPLVDSVQPDQKGLVGGTFTAQATVNGTGTSGPSLQKTLAGQFDFGSTNLNLHIDKIPDGNLYTRLLKKVVIAIVAIPELARNPAGTAAGFFEGLAKPGSGSSEDIGKSPINSIGMRGSMGTGLVTLQSAVVQSPLFRADAAGTITLAPVLTNSAIDIPVSVSLDRGVAQRINLLPANTPTNALFAKLPDFLAMKGTLGASKTEINKTVLAGAALQGLSGLAGKNSGLLQGLGSALTGSGSSGTNAPGASTNQSGGGLGNLLQGAGKLLGGSSTTGTNATAKTNSSPADSLLNNLFGPKKK